MTLLSSRSRALSKAAVTASSSMSRILIANRGGRPSDGRSASSSQVLSTRVSVLHQSAAEGSLLTAGSGPASPPPVAARCRSLTRNYDSGCDEQSHVERSSSRANPLLDKSVRYLVPA